LRGLQTPFRNVAREPGFARRQIVGVRAGAGRARVFRAVDLVVTIGCRAARPTRGRCLVRVRAAGGCRAACRAQRRVLAFARIAFVDRARLAVVTLRIFTALRAADTGTAQHAGTAVLRRVFAQHVRAGRNHARIIAVTVALDRTRLLLFAPVRDRAVLVRGAVAVVGCVCARTREAIVVRTAHAVVAILLCAAFAALSVTTFLGRVALRRAFAQALGTALIDRARIAVVAIFRTRTCFRRHGRAVAARVAGDAAVRCARAAGYGREFRATTGVRGERAQNEQEAHAEPVAEAASIHG